MEPLPVIVAGSGASLAAGLATSLGSLPILVARQPREALRHGLLAFAAGVMLAAAFLSLLLPGMEAARGLGIRPAAAAALVLGAMLFGALAVALLDARLVESERRRSMTAGARGAWLMIGAISLHNLPEGFAVGVSFAGGARQGLGTAIAIGLQNLPEGLALAGAVTSLGYSRLAAFLAATASGLIEPVGGVAGAVLVGIVRPLLPWGLGFAAGAMLQVVATHMIPASQDRRSAGGGLMVGLALMTFLATASE